MLKRQVLEIEGVNYEIREMSVREYLPLIDSKSDNEAESNNSEMQIRILEICVTREGQPVTADDLSMSAYLQIMPVLMKMNRLTPLESEGNG